MRSCTAFEDASSEPVVRLTAGGRTQIRAIDAGSGYLCQMEPVAHFGLGFVSVVDRLEVQWLDGTIMTIERPEIDRLLRVQHPKTSVF